MGKGSFYAAFESKAALFAATLTWYRDRAAATHERIQASKRGLAALLGFLDATLIEPSSAERRRGCLLVNSVLELESVEPELYEIAKHYLQELEQQCTSYLHEALTLGELREDLQPANVGPLTATLLQGLRVDSRMGLSRAALEKRVDAFLSLIAKEP